MINPMRKALHSSARYFSHLLAEVWLLVGLPFRRLRRGHAEVVVCMTSYPSRIRGSWVALESLFRQTKKDFTLILVLAESQFPARRLPMIIQALSMKGLEILWVKEDNGSFDHLWPAYQAFPGSKIISVDDDKVFPPHLVELLVRASELRPGEIIGARGWEMRVSGSQVVFGESWIRATSDTPSQKLFMPPGNGSLYPPGSLPEQAGDIQLMKKVCPRADDVWYWAMARLAETQSHCLGMPPHSPALTQIKTPALADENPGVSEFAAVLAEFELEKDLVRDLS